ncbi:hypothetical protein ACLOJK_027431, partial [Asimina triloba]
MGVHQSKCTAGAPVSVLHLLQAAAGVRSTDLSHSKSRQRQVDSNLTIDDRHQPPLHRPSNGRKTCQSSSSNLAMVEAIVGHGKQNRSSSSSG